MLELERPPNRKSKISFLLSFGITITLCLILITWAQGFFYVLLSSGAGLMLTFALVLIELIRKDSTLPLYEFWNWLTGKYLQFINYWILAVCIRFIFSAVGLAGADKRFSASKGNCTMWKSRQTLASDVTRIQYNRNYKGGNLSGRWFSNYTKWSLATKEKWKLFLLPFLLFLKLHETGKSIESTTDNYTLY